MVRHSTTNLKFPKFSAAVIIIDELNSSIIRHIVYRDRALKLSASVLSKRFEITKV